MSTVTGTGALARLGVRRDRIMIPAWLYVLTALVAATAYGLRHLLKTLLAREAFVATAGRTAAFRFLYGTINGSSIGALTAWRYGVLAAVGAALMTIFVVIRHTRADEEAGRLELAGSTAVGRGAPLTASLAVVAGACAILVVLMGCALWALRLPAAGSFALAAAVAATGLVFATVAAVMAQISGTARGARGLALAVLGVSYLLRGAADTVGGMSWLNWLSPLGWVGQVRPFAAERWPVLVLPVVCAAVLAGVAYLLAARRDHGAGLLRPRPGRPGAGAGLRGAWGLAWRLHRGALLAWVIAMILGWTVTGIVGKSIHSLVQGNSAIAHAFARLYGQTALTNAFLAAIMGLAGLVAAGYAISAVLRPHWEESGERAEPVLATATGRLKWAASHLVIAGAGAIALLVVAGLSAALGLGLSTGHAGAWVGRLLGAALVQAPAALAVAGVAVALFGLAPRWAVGGGWAALALAVLLVLLGPVLNLSHWVLDLSPFTHVPRLPGNPVTVVPLAWLAVAAAVLVAVGLAGLRRRDIPA